MKGIINVKEFLQLEDKRPFMFE